MKMGIKEFRERLGTVAQGGEMIELTHHGRVVGTYMPKRKFDPEAARLAAESIQRWQDDLRASGTDPEAVLRDMGLDPFGEPLDQADDR